MDAMSQAAAAVERLRLGSYSVACASRTSPRDRMIALCSLVRDGRFADRSASSSAGGLRVSSVVSFTVRGSAEPPAGGWVVACSSVI